MQHALRMRRSQTRAQLARDLRSFGSRQVPDAPQQAAEVLAVHILHRNERGALSLSNVVNAAHVRMRDLPSDGNLAMKPLQQPRFLRNSGRQKLQRHRLVQLQIGGPVNLAHAPSPDHRNDTVALRQQYSWSKPPILGGRTRRRRRLHLHRYSLCSVRIGIKRHRTLGTNPSRPDNLSLTSRATHRQLL